MDYSGYEAKPGIKFLLNIRNSTGEDSSDYISEDEINDETYSKEVNCMDALISNILKTKSELHLNKIKNKIKIQGELVTLLVKNEKYELNDAPPDPRITKESQLSNISKNNSVKINKEFLEIKEKLSLQNDLINKKEKKDSIINTNNFFITNKDIGETEMESIIEQIRISEIRSDELLNDIDECLKLGEDLDKMM